MRSKNDSSFGNFHPISLFVYYISAIVLTMFTKNPIMLAFALFGSSLFIIITNGAKDFFKSMRFYLPLFLIISVTNPLFSHNGKTILFFMNDNPVTLEAILYGADMALMICAVMFICRCMNFVMESDKLLCVFGTFSPKLSIVLSMSLRFIPLFKRKWKEIKDAQFSLARREKELFHVLVQKAGRRHVIRMYNTCFCCCIGIFHRQRRFLFLPRNRYVGYKYNVLYRIRGVRNHIVFPLYF